MRTLVCNGLLLCLGIASTAALPAVTVSFPGAEHYSDPGTRWGENIPTLDELTRHFEKLAERYLPPSQSLKIEVLDIDLAGRLRMGGPREIRVLTGRSDFPMIHLRYTLESDGKVAASGEETIADMGYFSGASPSGSRETLHYEKKMLESWFRKRFVGRHAGMAE